MEIIIGVLLLIVALATLAYGFWLTLGPAIAGLVDGEHDHRHNDKYTGIARAVYEIQHKRGLATRARIRERNRK